MLETEPLVQPIPEETQKLCDSREILRSSPEARVEALALLVRQGATLFVKTTEFSGERSAATAKDLGEAAIELFLTGRFCQVLRFRQGLQEVEAQFIDPKTLSLRYHERDFNDLIDARLDLAS